METSLDRRCRICGAQISDTNPDGIGSTCREVWTKALHATFYHFNGLEYWQAQIDFWLPAFILAFRNTKFRSTFKKEFYSSCFTRYSQGGRFSRKQLDIVKDMLVSGEWPKYPYSTKEGEWLSEYSNYLFHQHVNKFLLSMTEEQKLYRYNCAKKYYAENR